MNSNSIRRILCGIVATIALGCIAFTTVWEPGVQRSHATRALTVDTRKLSQAEINSRDASAFTNGVVTALETRMRKLFRKPARLDSTDLAVRVPGPAASGYAVADSFFSEELTKNGQCSLKLPANQRQHQFTMIDLERQILLTRFVAYLQTTQAHVDAQAFGIGAGVLAQAAAQILQARPFGEAALD
jgi:hypothetical protein